MKNTLIAIVLATVGLTAIAGEGGKSVDVAKPAVTAPAKKVTKVKHHKSHKKAAPKAVVAEKGHGGTK